MVRGRWVSSWTKRSRVGGWLRVYNATDVHLLATCLPAWCRTPNANSASKHASEFSLTLFQFFACLDACGWFWIRERNLAGRRVASPAVGTGGAGTNVEALAVKYCGCFKNRSTPILVFPSYSYVPLHRRAYRLGWTPFPLFKKSPQDIAPSSRKKPSLEIFHSLEVETTWNVDHSFEWWSFFQSNLCNSHVPRRIWMYHRRLLGLEKIWESY